MSESVKLPTYNIAIDEDEELGVYKMSFVEYPAVEVNWLAFSKEKECLYFANAEQRIVTSVALRADYPIYRIDKHNNEYYVVFEKDTIKKIVERFFKNGNIDKVNLNHNTDVSDCYLIESYFAGKDNQFNVAEGSWICSYKVDNPTVWEDIKANRFSGFSVEGYFDIEARKSVDEFDELIDDILK